jgi:hypothetical protein
MKLSERAGAYVASLERDLYWSAGRAATAAWLEGQGLPHGEALLRFQELYSGLTMTIRGNDRDAFSARLFLHQQVAENKPPAFEKIGDTWIFPCGDHRTAQFTFYITAEGAFCTVPDETIHVLHDDFATFIEGYALKNEIADWESNPAFFHVTSQEHLATLLRSEFDLITECSDTRASWWQNETLIVDNGVWLDEPSTYFHVYGKRRDACDTLIGRLKRQGVLQ